MILYMIKYFVLGKTLLITQYVVCSYLVILERTGSSGTLGAYPTLYIIYPIIQM